MTPFADDKFQSAIENCMLQLPFVLECSFSTANTSDSGQTVKVPLKTGLCVCDLAFQKN